MNDYSKNIAETEPTFEPIVRGEQTQVYLDTQPSRNVKKRKLNSMALNYHPDGADEPFQHQRKEAGTELAAAMNDDYFTPKQR